MRKVYQYKIKGQKRTKCPNCGRLGVKTVCKDRIIFRHTYQLEFGVPYFNDLCIMEEFNMNKKQIISLDNAKDIFKEELDFDILNNAYVNFEEWLIDNNYYLEEWQEDLEESRMKEEYLRS